MDFPHVIRGRSPEVFQRHITTDLIEACRKKDVPRMAALLRQGVNIHETDSLDRQAIDYVVPWSNSAALLLLLKHGAKLSDRQPHRFCMLLGAMRRWDAAVVMEVFSWLPTQTKTAMWAVACRHSICDARLMLDTVSNIDQEIEEGYRAIHLAIHKQAWAMASWLLCQGADPTYKTNADMDALMYAAKYYSDKGTAGHQRYHVLCEALLMTRIDLDAVDSFARTAHSLASLYRNTGMLALLTYADEHRAECWTTSLQQACTHVLGRTPGAISHILREDHTLPVLIKNMLIFPNPYRVHEGYKHLGAMMDDLADT